MIKRLFVIILLFGAISWVTACKHKQDESVQTIEGANERINALTRDNQNLLAEMKRKDAEMAALKNTENRDFDERVAKLKELHAQEVADLQDQISTYRIKQAQLISENLVLEQVVGQRERAGWFMRSRVELLIGGAVACIAAFLIIALYVGSRLYAVRNTMNQLLVRRMHSST
jgi:hypothetical protein